MKVGNGPILVHSKSKMVSRRTGKDVSVLNSHQTIREFFNKSSSPRLEIIHPKFEKKKKKKDVRRAKRTHEYR